MPYDKPYLAIPQQRALLLSRGMALPEPTKADEYLRRIGYYRLSAYWYPFRKLISRPDGTFQLSDDFKPGTEFKHATDLYAFDKALRLLTLDVIERIEVSVRTEIALTIGRHHPRAHRDPNHVDGKFKRVSAPNPRSMYAQWLEKLDGKEAHSKEEFAVHFRTKYPGDRMPVWIAVELLDFGPLSIFLSGMTYPDLKLVATSYGIARPHLLASWIRSVSEIRNICAHHSRLWNKPLIHQPALPQLGEISELDHLVARQNSNRRLYAALALMQHLLRQANPRTKWASRLKAHLATFPQAPNKSVADMGFPDGWENLPLWT